MEQSKRWTFARFHLPFSCFSSVPLQQSSLAVRHAEKRERKTVPTHAYHCVAAVGKVTTSSVLPLLLFDVVVVVVVERVGLVK